MLGRHLHDPEGIDGSGEGLGLMELETTFEPQKLTRRVSVRFENTLGPAWTSLAGREISGYEIRHGRTVATSATSVAIADGLGWVAGPVLGVTVHGLMEDQDVLRALFGRPRTRSLDSAIDDLTDVVVSNLDTAFVDHLALPTP